MNTLKFILEKYNIRFDSLTHMPIEIPNIGRDDLSALFCDLDYKTGVEIGVEQGKFSESLCKHNPGVKLSCIDPWEAYPGYRLNKSSEVVNNYYLEAKIRLAPYKCKLIKKFSLDAVKDFADRSLDFVYIDGNHNFQNCTNDIVEWTNKIKIGGILAGHDYVRHKRPTGMHVVEVVNAYTDAYAIKPWFVLGSKEKKEGEVRDSERSFMWVVEYLSNPSRNQQ
jgi:hypothetical protein